MRFLNKEIDVLDHGGLAREVARIGQLVIVRHGRGLIAAQVVHHLDDGLCGRIRAADAFIEILFAHDDQLDGPVELAFEIRDNLGSRVA